MHWSLYPKESRISYMCLGSLIRRAGLYVGLFGQNGSENSKVSSPMLLETQTEWNSRPVWVGVVNVQWV
jgi:hypothetical protein